MNQDGPSPNDFSREDMDRGSALERNVKSPSTWLRLFFMVVFMILYGVSRIVVAAVVALQFCWVLVSGETNERLESLGQALATYTYEVIRYLTFNTEVRPFPFDADWPSGPP